MTISRRQIMTIATAGMATTLTSGQAIARKQAKPASLAPLPPVRLANGKAAITPDEALARLIEGNRRFASDLPNLQTITATRRTELAKGQAPFAAIVCCSDSRAGPEQLFSAGLGELFVVRSAGNYVDTAGLGSLEFGVTALGAKVIVVMGHESCGAVKAAASVVKENAKLPGSLAKLVQPIVPAVLEAKSHNHDGDLVEAASRVNAQRVANELRETSSPLLAPAIKDGTLKVVAAYYDLDTGVVQFLDT